MRQKEKGQGLEQDLKPEQKAREEIDKLLSLAGFELRDFKDCTLRGSTPNAARNFAIKEFDNFNLSYAHEYESKPCNKPFKCGAFKGV